MKSEKVIPAQEGVPKRWYQDACGVALALELVGERWALLVIRELMLGARRFSELRADLPGLSANVLTQRLDGLERSGVVRRRRLPPPAAVQVYELTDWGREAEPIFQALARWALRSPDHDPSLPLSPVSAMLSLRMMLRTAREPVSMTLQFRFPTAVFSGRLSTSGLEIERSDVAAAEVVFETDTGTFIGLVYGKRPLDAAEAAGRLRLEGDRALAQRFIDCFALPPKLLAAAD